MASFVLPSRLLLFELARTETVINHLERLNTRTQYNHLKDKCDCHCWEKYQESLNMAKRESEEEKRDLIQEIEVALQKASMVWSEAHNNTKSTNQNTQNLSKQTGLAANPGRQIGSAETKPHQSGTIVSKQLNRNSTTTATTSSTTVHQKPNIKFKPAHLSAPYKTNPVVKRRSRIVARGSKSVVIKSTDSSAPKNGGDGDKKEIISCQSPESDCAVEVMNHNDDGLLVDSEINVMHLKEEGFACSCHVGERKQRRVALLEQLDRFYSSLLRYKFGQNQPTLECLNRLFPAKVDDPAQLYNTILNQCQTANHLLIRFKSIIDLINMKPVNPNQLDWIQTIYTLFERLKDKMEFLSNQCTDETIGSHANEGNDSENPLEHWLRERKTLAKDFEWRVSQPVSLLEAYMTVGRTTVESGPSRSWQMAGLPRFCGSVNEIRKFFCLWHEAEIVQYESKLLTHYEQSLPRILDSISKQQDLPSVFREVVGLICCKRPVALRDTFGD